MRQIFLTCLAIVLSLSTISAKEKTKWQKLFNGKNLKGFEILSGTAEYTIENGEIVGTSKTGTGNTFLATKNTYSDFILEYDMKMETGLNSGVQIRSLIKGEEHGGRVYGYQVECDDSDRAWAGGIYDEARRGWLYSLEYNQPAKKSFKRGQWNSYRVEAIGNNIRTFINGVPCADLMDDLTLEGIIAFQVHGIGSNKEKAGKTIRWKNVRIMTEDLANEKTACNKSIRQVSYLNNTLTQRETEEGWKLLWDGKTNKGWKGAKIKTFPTKGWEMKDGVLSVLSSGGAESRNGGDIITDRKYSNFELEVDFCLTEGANSGIKYFVNPDLNTGAGSAIGCEFQILDDKKHPDAKKGNLGNRTLASLYDLIPADGRMFNKNLRNKRFNGIGKWNRARVVVTGNKVAHYLNGSKVIEYERNTQEWDAFVNYSKYKNWPNFGNAKEGYILLQDHGDKVSFRNIKIKEL